MKLLSVTISYMWINQFIRMQTKLKLSVENQDIKKAQQMARKTEPIDELLNQIEILSESKRDLKSVIAVKLLEYEGGFNMNESDQLMR